MRRAHLHDRPELPLVVAVPGGSFVMGAAQIREAEAPNPPHEVMLSPFLMGVYPVTNAEYRAFVAATEAAAPPGWQDRRYSHPEQPVIGVSWDDAVAYCDWAQATLPTEAQWERCARGPDGRRYPWGEAEPDDHLAHFAQDWNRGGPSRIGTHAAGRSPVGCYHLAGNVWEWCRDSWLKEAHEIRRAQPRDPLVQADTPVRPLRGGCWRSIDCKLQGAYRNWFHRIARHTTIGFRIAAQA